MSHDFHRIWREQVAAVPVMQHRYGDAAAFDYLVGEKLMHFAEAAQQHPAFARELPSFVAAVRSLFDPATMEQELRRLAWTLQAEEAAQAEFRGLAGDEDEEWLLDTPEEAAARRARFARLRSLLTAPSLGIA